MTTAKNLFQVYRLIPEYDDRDGVCCVHYVEILGRRYITEALAHKMAQRETMHDEDQVVVVRENDPTLTHCAPKHRADAGIDCPF